MVNDVVAICCSDIHLSHVPPKLRRTEPNWYAAMARPLGQIRELAGFHQCPIIVAGDVFDDGWRTHKCPPELINFAIKHLPPCYAIPGQHDLPNHRYEDMERSGYWTLVQAGVIKDLHPGVPVAVGPLVLHGFPWGFPVRKRDVTGDLALHVAVVHSYIWDCDEHAHPGAALDNHLSVAEFEGYDTVIVGDNHKGFVNGRVMNCGTSMIRKADEVGYRPAVGLLHSDGSVSPHYLDMSQDRYDVSSEVDQTPRSIEGVKKFVDELSGLGGQELYDFRDALVQALKTRYSGVAGDVRDAVLRSVQN